MEDTQILNCFAYLGIFFVAKICLRIVWKFYTFLKMYILPKLVLKKIDLRNQFGDWAMVTGCTQGIGRAYVKALASEGMNIVLVARNMEKLEEVKKEITNLFAVSVETIVVDFGEESSCSTVVNRVEKLGLELGILGTTIHHKFNFCVCYNFFSSIVNYF